MELSRRRRPSSSSLVFGFGCLWKWALYYSFPKPALFITLDPLERGPLVAIDVDQLDKALLLSIVPMLWDSHVDFPGWKKIELAEVLHAEL
jgi:hypothetical protein